MIFILDNNESYEDHWRYFVESDMPSEAIQAFYPKFTLLGMADTITWLDPNQKPLTTVDIEGFPDWWQEQEFKEYLLGLQPWKSHPEVQQALSRKIESLTSIIENYSAFSKDVTSNSKLLFLQRIQAIQEFLGA